jgi:hypothetical protein
MPQYAGWHKQDAWTFEIFCRPVGEDRGWYWWQRDPLKSEPAIDPAPSGPFDSPLDAYLDATDCDL